jgi:hypothetical protein
LDCGESGIVNIASLWNDEEDFALVVDEECRVPLMAAFPQTGSIVVARLNGADW